MSTPVINAIDNVNQSALETVFGSIAADSTARDNLSQSNRNIDKVSTNSGVIKTLNSNEDAILRLLCRREGRDPSNFVNLSDVADDVSLVRDLSVRQTMTDIIQFSDKASSALSANDRTTREMMCFPAGLDATTFTDVADVASDQAAMNAISATAQAIGSAAVLPLAMKEVIASQTAMQEVAASQTAMQEVAGSLTAMQELAASQTAMQEVAASQTAMQEVAASQTAMQEVATSLTAMQEVAGSQTAMQELAASQTAMQEVAGSLTAMQEVAPSLTAMQEVAASQTAMQELAASQTAMQEVAASQTAMDSIASDANDIIAENTVLNSATATTEFITSPLVTDLSVNFNSGNNAAQTITNDRVLVVTNRNDVNGNADIDIDYVNDVGPETQPDTTFIINSASIGNEGNNGDGSADVSGIIIN